MVAGLRQQPELAMCSEFWRTAASAPSQFEFRVVDVRQNVGRTVSTGFWRRPATAVIPKSN